MGHRNVMKAQDLNSSKDNFLFIQNVDIALERWLLFNNVLKEIWGRPIHQESTLDALTTFYQRRYLNKDAGFLKKFLTTIYNAYSLSKRQRKDKKSSHKQTRRTMPEVCFSFCPSCFEAIFSCHCYLVAVHISLFDWCYYIGVLCHKTVFKNFWK